MKKPVLRGHIHQEAFFIALGACTMLIAKSTTSISFAAALTYSIALLLLLGISAIYHRPTWNLRSRAILRRLDHSAIYILIGGSFTPVCLLALPDVDGVKLLKIVWIAVVFGIFQSIFWIKAPKWLAAILYTSVGLFVVPYLPQLSVSLGSTNVILLVAGGLLFVAGGIFYAIKKPNFFPGVFGYHELFHLLVVIGIFLNFLVMYQLVQ